MKAMKSPSIVAVSVALSIAVLATEVTSLAPLRRIPVPTSRTARLVSSTTTALHSSAAASPPNAGGGRAPLEKLSRKVCLMVEPTPFTHVSGYANRFKEMLKFLKKAGDQVDILTVDSKTPSKDLPTEYQGYPVRHTQGFTFPLYNHISLTIDLPEMKGAEIIERFKPDIIHVTSPGFLLFAAIFYARVMKIPLVMSYHTHLPTYGK
jgi:sulfoquinovosyltransferase